MQGKELLVGIGAGIAAYKTAELVSQCVQSGAYVTVILTERAQRFIGATTFQALTGRPVYADMFAPEEHHRGEHIGLAGRAELVCIAPATANLLAKLAHGIADDLLTTAVLASTCPVLLAPAMNCEMWAKPAVKRNVEQLRADGMIIVEPGEGWLSCGQVGPGRMAEVDRIVQAIDKAFETGQQKKVQGC